MIFLMSSKASSVICPRVCPISLKIPSAGIPHEILQKNPPKINSGISPTIPSGIPSTVPQGTHTRILPSITPKNNFSREYLKNFPNSSIMHFSKYSYEKKSLESVSTVTTFSCNNCSKKIFKGSLKKNRSKIFSEIS